MAEDRPEIPEAMKREVRQRCGFGCLICGLTLYEYELVELQEGQASRFDRISGRHHILTDILSP